jgi:hypothetical protein
MDHTEATVWLGGNAVFTAQNNYCTPCYTKPNLRKRHLLSATKEIPDPSKSIEPRASLEMPSAAPPSGLRVLAFGRPCSVWRGSDWEA